MPKEKVTDPITDQEIAFARLVLAGEMSDQQAAEAAGLNPTTAAYTKAKPRVQDWMRQHRAAMDKLILEQEADNLRRRNAVRERVLNRLWTVADLAPDQTRNSMTSQMKALAMIVAIEGLLPNPANDRRTTAAHTSLAPAATPKIYQSEWLRERNSTTSSQPVTEQDHPDSAPAALVAAPPAPVSAPPPPPGLDPGKPIAPRALTFAEENSSPYTSFVPDTRGSLHLPKSIFTHRRR